MPVGVLLITHGNNGLALLRSAKGMLQALPLEVATLSVLNSADPKRLLRDAHTLCDELDRGQGVLILTDLYGATPSNIANSLCPHPHRRVISGLNLPMLTRIFNYPNLPLDELVEKAISGGRDGVFLCTAQDKDS